MLKLSVFGGSGFIGTNFLLSASYPMDVELAGRKQKISFHPNILDFVSTVDNYNVNTDPYIDIDTNLRLLIEKLVCAKVFHGTDTVYNFVSSWFVYGDTDIPAKEDSECKPTGFYSITKRAAEQLLISYCQTFDMKYRILRLGNVIGVGDKKISRKKNALQHIIRELAQGRDVDYLYKGGAIRDYIDVRDCVEAISLVLEKGNLNEIYNIANGQGLNVNDLVGVAHRESEFKSKITEIPVPDFHKTVQTPKMYLNVDKIKKLGYVQRHDIKQSVKELVHYYANEER